mgnify:FL=1
MISEGQRNDINYAIPLLDQIEINGSNVLADRGYDSNKLLDYVYARGGEPTIPSRKGAKFERHCDWWLYKERHLVENGLKKERAFSFRSFAKDMKKAPSLSPQACPLADGMNYLPASWPLQQSLITWSIIAMS